VSRIPGPRKGSNLVPQALQGRCNAAVHPAGVLSVDPARLTVLLPQSLDRQPGEIPRPARAGAPPRGEAPSNDALPLPMASSLCNQRSSPLRPQLICFASTQRNPALQLPQPPRIMGKGVKPVCSSMNQTPDQGSRAASTSSRVPPGAARPPHRPQPGLPPLPQQFGPQLWPCQRNAGPLRDGLKAWIHFKNRSLRGC